MKKFLAITLFIGLVIPTIIFYLAFVNYTNRNEVGIARNHFTGEMWLQETGGWKFTAPWVAVSRIDTRPIRVCMTTAGRGVNCKLVRFEPKEYKSFVETEGFRYYWWANRISFNWGYSEEYRGMKDILRGYAFSARKYPFITIIDDYADSR